MAGRATATTPQSVRTTALPPSVRRELTDGQAVALLEWVRASEARIAAPSSSETLAAFVAATTAPALHDAIALPATRAWALWLTRQWAGLPEET